MRASSMAKGAEASEGVMCLTATGKCALQSTARGAGEAAKPTRTALGETYGGGADFPISFPDTPKRSPKGRPAESRRRLAEELRTLSAGLERGGDGLGSALPCARVSGQQQTDA